MSFTMTSKKRQCEEVKVIDNKLIAALGFVFYPDIAPRVGIDPLLKGNDMQSLDIYRAHLPTGLFKAMVEDLSIVMENLVIIGLKEPS